MKKNIALLSLLVFISFGFTAIKGEEWAKLETGDYSIEYPSTWALDQSGQMGTSFFVMSELDSKKDKFRENVNLLVQDLTGYNMDLDKYSELSAEQVKTMIKNSKLIENQRIKSASGQYQKVIYLGDEGDFHLQFEQYYWVVNNKAYVLTLTCEKKNFKKYKKTGERILDSFKLK